MKRKTQWHIHTQAAIPEKALYSKIIATSGLLPRSKAVKEFLVENNRMDEEFFKQLNIKEMSTGERRFFWAKIVY